MATSKTIKEIRVENIRAIINRFDSLKDFAVAIDREQALASQIKSGRIGGQLSRHIEKMLKLDHGYLDTVHNSADEFEDLLIRAKQLYERERISNNERRLIEMYRQLSEEKQGLANSLIANLLD